MANVPELLKKASATLETLSALAKFAGPEAAVVVEGLKIAHKIIGGISFGVGGYDNLITELEALDAINKDILARGVTGADLKAKVAEIKANDKQVDAILAKLKAAKAAAKAAKK